jgi:monovalent cation:H+ antiporter-2, CPA2 family
MIATDELMFQAGIIMLVAFIGAALASKAKQSVILGYILAGILIGPYIYFEIAGFTYDGLIKDTEFVGLLSNFGLILLMFFVGLEFSISKLKRTKAPAIILALMDVGIGMFVGILIGFSMGWPIVDTIFLAAIISMSSVAITGKALQEMKSISGKESEYILGMVIVESFISMVLLTIAGGLMFESDTEGTDLTSLIVGILAFYAFFIFLAIVVIPRVVKYFEGIKSNELFVLFALGLVFLSAALAEVAGISSIIGAFFIGMVFSETKLANRIADRITPFRDALVAVFFISFGMMIDISMLEDIVPILIIAIPATLFYEVIMLALISYMLGFTAKASVFMGTSNTGRSSEAVMYASVASSSPTVVKGAEINPFTGVFCFIMSSFAPVLMKYSDSVTKFLTKITPRFMRYGGSLINRTMNKIIFPTSLKLFERTRRLEVLLVLYLATLVALMVMPFPYSLIVFIIGSAIVVVTYLTLEADLFNVVRTTNFENLGVVTTDPGHISRFISGFVSLSLVTIQSIALLFSIWWMSSLIILVSYFIIIMWMTRSVYRLTRTPHFNITAKPVKRRQPKNKQKPFQPSFQAPASRPDPGWDLEPPAPEPVSESLSTSEPGWDLAPPEPTMGAEQDDEQFTPETPAKARKPKPKEKVQGTVPEAEVEDSKWNRL